MQWFGNARADNLGDPAFVQRLREAGCWMLALGIETESEETRKDMMKRLEGKKIRTALTNMRAAGIKSFGFFILGYPGETPQNARSHDRLRHRSRSGFRQFLSRRCPIRGPSSTPRPSATGSWPVKTGRRWSTRTTCFGATASTRRSSWTRSTARSAASTCGPRYLVRHAGDVVRLMSTKWSVAWHVASRFLFGAPVTDAAGPPVAPGGQRAA